MTRAYVRVVGLVLIGVAALDALLGLLALQPPPASMGRKVYATWVADLAIHGAASAVTVLVLFAAGAVCWWASRRKGDRLTPAVAWWLAGSAVTVWAVHGAESAFTSYGSSGVAQAVLLAVSALVLRPTTFKPAGTPTGTAAPPPSWHEQA